MAIVSTKRRDVVLTRNGITLEGAWAWRFKNWIDRRWIARYNDLPATKAPDAGSGSPLEDKAARRWTRRR